MSEVKLGQLVGEGEERDAIHVAIAPVVAAEPLDPGDHVGLGADGKANQRSPHIGIVDPFLTKHLQPGDRFYLLLYPNTVTGMRHHWSHPAFVFENPLRSASELWIRAFAEGINQTFESLMQDATSYVDYDNREYDNSESYQSPEFGTWEEFWRHFERATGKVVEDIGCTPYKCSC